MLLLHKFICLEDTNATTPFKTLMFLIHITKRIKDFAKAILNSSFKACAVHWERLLRRLRELENGSQKVVYVYKMLNFLNCIYGVPIRYFAPLIRGTRPATDEAH